MIIEEESGQYFWKQNSLSDDSKGTSTQTILKNVESEEEKSVSTNDKRDSVHSNWNELSSVNGETEYEYIVVLANMQASL